MTPGEDKSARRHGTIVRGVKILGTGSALPGQVVSNEDIEQRVKTNANWIEKNLGIRERRVASENESTSVLGIRAAKKALESAEILPEEIELIIVATVTPDYLTPSTACVIQEKIGAINAAAFDVSAACAGFMYGMTIAAQFISSGTYTKVLMIGSDTLSKWTNWEDRNCVFFGDGAGAIVMTYAHHGEGFLATKLYANGAGWKSFYIPAGGSALPSSKQTIEDKMHYWRMDGKAVYKTAGEVLPKAISEVLKVANVTPDQIKYICPHQPSIRILQDVAKSLGVPFSKVLTTMERYGNTSGASIGVTLDDINRSRKLDPGDIIVFAGIGAGWTWGASVLKWA